jgi:hypothetical protein
MPPNKDFFTYQQCMDYCSNNYNTAKSKPSNLQVFYRTLRESEDRLPSAPHATYKEAFIGTRALFGLPEIEFFSYQQCMDYCSNSYDKAKPKPSNLRAFYRTLSESEDRLPSNLARRYIEEFVGLRTIFGLPEIEFFSYHQCMDYCLNNYNIAKSKPVNLGTFYRTLSESEDRLPSNPKRTYKEEFIGTRTLFGLPEIVRCQLTCP